MIKDTTNRYIEYMIKDTKIDSFEKLLLISLIDNVSLYELILIDEIKILKNKIETGFFENIANPYNLEIIFKYAVVIENLSKKGILYRFSTSLNDYLYRLTERIINNYKKFNRKYFFEIFPIIAKVLNYLVTFDFNIINLKEFLIENISFYESGNDRIPKFIIKNIDKNFNENFPNGIIPLGMAHGSLGVLVSLSKIYKSYSKSYETHVKNLFSLYEILSKTEDGFIIYPNFVTYDEYLKRKFKTNIKQFRAAWCSGNLITSYSLFKVCSNMNWIDKGKLYYNEVIEIICNDIEKYNLELPIICHGYSFPLILINKLLISNYDKNILSSKNLKFLDLLEKRRKELINKLIGILDVGEMTYVIENYFFNDYSFLTGITGVIFALIQSNYIYNKDYSNISNNLLNI